MTKVFAIARDGRELEVAGKYGGTVESLMENLRANAMTGSAVPLAEVEVELEDGGMIPYGDVNTFEELSPF